MSQRPKHYDRPGKRPGPPRTPHGGGTRQDERGQREAVEQLGLAPGGFECDAERCDTPISCDAFRRCLAND